TPHRGYHGRCEASCQAQGRSAGAAASCCQALGAHPSRKNIFWRTPEWDPLRRLIGGTGRTFEGGALCVDMHRFFPFYPPQLTSLRCLPRPPRKRRLQATWSPPFCCSSAPCSSSCPSPACPWRQRSSPPIAGLHCASAAIPTAAMFNRRGSARELGSRAFAVG